MCWIRSAKVGVDVCYEVEYCALLNFYSLFHGSAFYFACALIFVGHVVVVLFELVTSQADSGLQQYIICQGACICVCVFKRVACSFVWFFSLGQRLL